MLKHECPNCGVPVPANARGGHCPRCLLLRGLDSDPDQSSDHDTVDMAARPGLVLETIGATIDRVPRVLLRDTALGEEPSPIFRPMRDDETSIRYRIDGEIARGGMGQVLKGRDPDLGRDVAIKVLREDFRNDADMVRRFVEEAQIGGQLQHPGIVPIYELGIFGDGRPYFSMKLIKGDTLAKLLEARDRPDDGLPRFLAIFEAVTQTVAYAHARGVIHRDLKPSNVMVGAFGEVQVMDWGLAKVLPRGGVADDATAGKIHGEETVISTARSGAEGSELSRAGSAMGTPSYMAPEQARGEVERIDERADVFALGSVLCEILTSQPAFRGRNSGEIQRMAARGDTADALTRLNRGGIDHELVDLARECLARESADRPRDAGVVSRRLTGYLTSVQERLRLTELARVASSARAEEAVRTAEVAEASAAAERRARRMQLGLAGVVLALTILGGLGTTAWLQQRAARLGRIDVALKEAELLFDQAAAETAKVSGKWQEARLALKRSADLLAETNAADAMARVADLEHRIDAGEAQAHFDEALIGRLESVRFRREHRLAEAGEPGKRADAQTEIDYAALFREAELDPDRLDAAAWKHHLAGRPAKLVVAIVAALDDWATVRRRAAGDQAILATKRLIDAVGAIDPDPWRNDLRKAISARDNDTLVRLANDSRLTDQPPPSLVLLAIELTAVKQEDLAIDTLRRAQRRYPDNFPINDLLSWVLDAQTAWGFYRDRIPEAVRFATVAVALNPRAGMPRATLAMLLSYAGQNEEAEWEFREAIRLQPDYPNVYTHYALMLQYAGRFEEASVQLRAALRLKPDWADARSFLGRILNFLGRYDEAVSELRETIRIRPDLAQPHDYLAIALARQGKIDEALREWRAAVRIAANYSDTYGHMFSMMREQGKLEEAVAECRQWIRAKPNALDPRDCLVDFFRTLGRNDDAVVEIREAVRLLPDRPLPYVWLGLIELWNGNEQAAIAASRKALELEPDIVDAHRCIGLAFLSLGRRGAADAAFRKAQKLAPAHAEIPGELRMVALAPRLPAVLRGEDRPANPAERIDFANLGYHCRRFAAAARLYAEALEEDPALADDRKAHHARQAAVYAALAGCVDGRDDPPPTPDKRTALRRQAHKLLHDDLDAWARFLERDPKEAKNVVTALRGLRDDYALANVREADALAKLPEHERKDWQLLWADVEALIRRAREPKP